MRRATAWTAVIALAGIVVASAPTVSAARAEKDAYIVAECPQDGNPQSVERFEFPNPNDPNRVLIRGAHNIYNEFVLEDDGWSLVGENNTMANVNASESFATIWGTFDWDGNLGHFEGTWSWGNSAYGRASGRSDDGRLLKVTLGLDPSDYPHLDDCEDYGVTELLIISPHG